ncbi:pentapeptide repeat-containing protein [Streptomyces sp. NBC_01506]|uniref:pentapeptide repeat-containing protein n=1 Tax=Streptomyces sp. NBC_01506 TaxID=2903887 RepID=UPI0038667447
MRQTVLAAAAGASVLLGAVFTARTYGLSRRGQVTERFRAAVGLLASDKLTERLGAVYSLEHVMAESPEEHNTVVGVLAALIRENTRRDTAPSPGTEPPEQGMREPVPDWGTEPPADIRAAVDVLARRPERPEPRRVDLRSATLVGLIVRGFDFDAPLSRIYFTGADLRRADLRGADLTDSILNASELCLAALGSARLDHAQLTGADLRGASLVGATLLGTDLCGADLRDTEHLTAGQLSGAEIDETSRLPRNSPPTHGSWPAWRTASPGANGRSRGACTRRPLHRRPLRRRVREPGLPLCRRWRLRTSSAWTIRSTVRSTIRRRPASTPAHPCAPASRSTGACRSTTP